MRLSTTLYQQVGQNLRGKIVLIAGGTSGIGLEAAKAYQKLGAQLVIGSRSDEKANIASAAINSTDGPKPVFYPLNLFSFKSVSSFVDSYSKNIGMVPDVLLNNAGLMMKERTLTEDKEEATMQANFLSQALLTLKLLKKNLDRASWEQQVRIVFTGAAAHKQASPDFMDDSAVDKYDFWGTYLQSKLAQVSFSNGLQRMISSTHPLYLPESVRFLSSRSDVDLLSVTVDPGWIKTGLLREEYGFSEADIKKKLGGAKMTHQEGSKILVWAGTCPRESLGNGGVFIAKQRIFAENKHAKQKEYQDRVMNWTLHKIGPYL